MSELGVARYLQKTEEKMWFWQGWELVIPISLIHLFSPKMTPHGVFLVTFMITFKHILMECSDLIEIRNKYYVVESLKVLFAQESPVNITNFLKEINVFNKM